MGISHRNLINPSRYFSRYRQNEHPAAFELLVADVFSQILSLPFQSSSTDNPSIIHRVLWTGEYHARSRTITKSPRGPDSICYAFGFQILVECTLKDGANQWRHEFVEAIDHYTAFVSQPNIRRESLFLALVSKKLHTDTHMAFRQKAIEGLNVFLLEATSLAKICYFSKIAFSSRHLDLQALMRSLVECLGRSSSLREYRKEAGNIISDWGRNILRSERTVFFGLKSLAAMQKIGSNIVGTSAILRNLKADRDFRFYINVLGQADLATLIKDGLICERFARLITTPYEPLFCRVDNADYKYRSNRLVRAVEETNG